MAALAKVLANEGRGEPETRLLWAAGKDTMMACFHIGVYSDRELVGQGVCITLLECNLGIIFLVYASLVLVML